MKNRTSNTVLVRYKRRRTVAATSQTTTSRVTVARSAAMPVTAADNVVQSQVRGPYGNSSAFRVALEQMQADMDAIRRDGKSNRRSR